MMMMLELAYGLQDCHFVAPSTKQLLFHDELEYRLTPVLSHIILLNGALRLGDGNESESMSSNKIIA